MFDWMKNNRVATGILTGAGSGAMAGIAAGPWGMVAGAAIGATMGGISGEEANKEAWASRQEKKAQAIANADAQNAEALKSWNKRKSALGISEAGSGATMGAGSIIEGNNQAAGLTSLV